MIDVSGLSDSEVNIVNELVTSMSMKNIELKKHHSS